MLNNSDKNILSNDILSYSINELYDKAIHDIRIQGKSSQQAKTHMARMEALMAISEELKTAENYYYLGNLQLEIGEYEKAIKTLTIGISKAPKTTKLNASDNSTTGTKHYGCLFQPAMETPESKSVDESQLKTDAEFKPIK